MSGLMRTDGPAGPRDGSKGARSGAIAALAFALVVQAFATLPAVGAFAAASPRAAASARAVTAIGTRCCMGMAYDDATGSLIVFGGRTSDTAAYDDTTWVGSLDASAQHLTWTQITGSQLVCTPSCPPGRHSTRMVYDATHDELVMFGGLGQGAVSLSDTWTGRWDGTTFTWIQRCLTGSCPHQPAGRSSQGLAYDANNKVVVMYGGNPGTCPATGGPFCDTWLWDGGTNTWSRACSSCPPGARSSGGMAYDEALQRVVMFGGQGQGGVLADTWVWDGSTWINPATTCTPDCSGLARSTHRVAYDRFTSQFVAFGGVNQAGALLDDTWVLQGTLANLIWTDVSAASPAKPSTRCCGGMAYDQAHRVVVYYGGGGDLHLAQFDDSWVGTFQSATGAFPWRCVDGTCTPG